MDEIVSSAAFSSLPSVMMVSSMPCLIPRLSNEMSDLALTLYLPCSILTDELKEFAFRISSVAVVIPGQTLTVIAFLVIARAPICAYALPFVGTGDHICARRQFSTDSIILKYRHKKVKQGINLLDLDDFRVLC